MHNSYSNMRSAPDAGGRPTRPPVPAHEPASPRATSVPLRAGWRRLVWYIEHSLFGDAVGAVCLLGLLYLGLHLSPLIERLIAR